MSMSTGIVTTLAQFEWLERLWLKPGNSDLAPSVDSLFMFILWVNIISFIVLMVPMTYWCWRWRRRPGVPAKRTPNHSTPLEVSWVVVPLIVVVIIFFWGFTGYVNAQLAPSNAEVIYVTGKRWAWEATYANGANSGESVHFDTSQVNDGLRRAAESVPVFVVPAGKPVKFMLTSLDVIHSFYIPDMRTKIDVMPNRYTSLTFVPQSAKAPSGTGSLYADGKKRPGTDAYIFCAEYCGQNHSEMGGILRVVEPEEYERTIKEWGDIDTNYLTPDGKTDPKLAAGKTALPLWQLGEWVHKNKGCVQCHSMDGTKGTGPSWKGYYGEVVKFADGAALSASMYQMKDMDEAWAAYIRESILVPGKHLHEGFANNMPSYAGQLSEKQIAGVIAYFRHIGGKDASSTPSSTPASPTPPKN